MCKCENVQMCKCENVQMCKWSPFVPAMQVLSRAKVTICTFANGRLLCMLCKFLVVQR